MEPHFRASIAVHTGLLSKEETKKIFPSIIKDNVLPMNLYFDGYAPVFFETGIWDEYGFYLQKLIKDTKLYGFDSIVKIYLGSARGFTFKIAEDILNLLPLQRRKLLKPDFFCYSQKVESAGFLVD